MTTRFATAITEEPSSSKAALEVVKKAKAKLQGQAPSLAFLFCSSHYNYNEVLNTIQKEIGPIVLVGCSTAGEFTEEKVTNGGMALALVGGSSYQFRVGIGDKLSLGQLKAMQKALNGEKSIPSDFQHHAALLFIDGLVGKGEETALAAANLLGNQVMLAGGAAGDDLQFKNTKVFSSQYAYSDAVSVCEVFSKKNLVLSVKHGHVPLSGPLQVTKSKGNILYELDGKPALDVWKETLLAVKPELGSNPAAFQSPQEVSKILLKYEAGLMAGDEFKIRFPLSANPDGSLNFVCSIIEGSVLRIMDSQGDNQIASARKAADDALTSAKGSKIAGAVVFDCACRSMLLGNRFSEAIDEIKKTLGPIPVIGLETYGEIAMQKDQLSGFHNTTTVIVLFLE